MPAREPPPERYFHRHGLSTRGLHAAAGGFVNRVWMTDDVVLRVSQFARHAREAQVASGALAAGVRTARPLFWGRHYSLWERLPGQVTPEIPPEVWHDVLDDLEKLHAHAPLPNPRRLPDWLGRPELIAQTQVQANWTADETALLRRFLGTPYPPGRPVFIHGDVYHQNILVSAQGGYAGLIDWGNARWATLEHEAGTIENLDVVRERWGERLNWPLVWRVRLDLLLMVASLERAPFELVRETLGTLEASEPSNRPATPLSSRSRAARGVSGPGV